MTAPSGLPSGACGAETVGGDSRSSGDGSLRSGARISRDEEGPPGLMDSPALTPSTEFDLEGAVVEASHGLTDGVHTLAPVEAGIDHPAPLDKELADGVVAASVTGGDADGRRLLA